MIRVLLTNHKTSAVQSKQEKSRIVSSDCSHIFMSSTADYPENLPLYKALSLLKNNLDLLVEFYLKLARSYASHYKNKEAFLKQMQEFKGELEIIIETFQSLSDWGIESDLTKIIAFLSCDSYPLLFNTLRTNYYKVYLMDYESFQQFIKLSLDSMWKPCYSLNSYVFYQLIKGKRELSKNKRVQKVAKAIQVAENTTVFILSKGSELIRWTAEVLDKSWNHYECVPVLYKSVKTKTDQLVLWVFQHNPKILSSNFNKAKRLCGQIEEIESLMKLQLPQHCFSAIDRGLTVLRLGKMQRFLKQKMWDVCDIDGDGIVTIGDLYVSIRKFDIYEALYRFLKQYQAKS